MEISISNSDGTHKTCPHGASVNYPTGTIRRVNVNDVICWTCPHFVRTDNEKKIECNFKER